MLESALSYLARGWSVFPLKDKRTPHVPWKERQRTLPTPADVAAWWTQHPQALVGVALGRVSGVVRIDADGQVPESELSKEPTATFSTPSGGRGWLYAYEDGLRTAVLWRGSGDHQELRVQSDGAYTVVPPSAGYAWIGDSPIARSAMLQQLVLAQVVADLEREVSPLLRDVEPELLLEALAFVPADDYTYWIRVGMALHSLGPQWLEKWDVWSRMSAKYKLGECERRWHTFGSRHGVTARSILHLASLHGWKNPQKYEPVDDFGNAHAFARLHGTNIKHSAIRGWFAWDGRRWQSGQEAHKLAYAAMKGVIEDRWNRACTSLKRHVEQHPEDVVSRRRKSGTLKHIKRYKHDQYVRSALAVAAADPAVSCDYRQYDAHPWLLNCWNGTLDLRTQELYEHAMEDLLTQVSPVSYVASAQCPRWEKFLTEVFADRMDLVRWMHKLLGSCTAGVVREHILPLLYGSGRNGKSTMVEAIAHVLGEDYAWLTGSGFTLQKNDQHPERLMRLYGKRFVADLETGDGMRLDEELIKRLTGGDKVTARELYQSSISFLPTHKLLIATNNEPDIRSQGSAIWSRIRKVPFDVSFLGREDFCLKDTFKDGEAEGILAWLVQGCSLWQSEGLGDVEAVRVSTEVYRLEQNTVKTFLEQRYKREGRTRKSIVSAEYRAWCSINGYNAVKPKAFGQGLIELGVSSDDNYYHLSALD